MSGAVSSGCCCTKESCPACCDFWACSPSSPFTILLTGSWVSEETLSPSGQVFTTGQINWSITATLQRTGTDCATYRYYANTCTFSYEYIKRHIDFMGAEDDGSAAMGGVAGRCTVWSRYDLDGDGFYEGALAFPGPGGLEYEGQYNDQCTNSACPSEFSPTIAATGRCACTFNNFCRDNSGYTCENSSNAEDQCRSWNCKSYSGGYADAGACAGYGHKDAADIEAKIIREKTWVWNATLQGRPAQYNIGGQLINTGLDNGLEPNRPNHQNLWVPGSVITIACKRNCDPDCDSPILIFNPNPSQVVSGMYTEDFCMSPCATMGCRAPTTDCQTSYTMNLPQINPWVIFGSGSCLSDTTFDSPITSKPAVTCGGAPNSCSDDLPSVNFSGIGPQTNLEPPSSFSSVPGAPPVGGIFQGLLLNMCGIDQYCSPLDRTYTEKKVAYDINDSTSGKSYPDCCTLRYLSHTEITPCTYTTESGPVTVNITVAYADGFESVCSEFPTVFGVTTHTIEWGFEII